ncbi:hypothetical protein A7K50_12455 [Dehalobacter sp. MCB1]|nr:hypothetical protein A7K50_12455 [Dehalobacter sp. MCB1]
MPPKEQRQWYENALVLTVAGSIIVVIGQLAGTIIPIMYGPEDISDFSITANPVDIYVKHSEQTESNLLSYANVEIKVDDFHPYLRPYRYYIYLKILNYPKGTELTTLGLQKVGVGGYSILDIAIDKDITFFDEPMEIQGIGEDGKTHNITIYLSARW